MSADSLTIIGAGPKAMAIATKACVLSELGFSVPKIRIIERNGIGAYWKDGSGFTNGRLRLGTSPEKDVGFPYCSSCWGDDFNSHVDSYMQRYSWQHFLIEKRAYASWVDRGRPQPEHRMWVEYLEWIFKKISRISSQVELVEANFEGFEFSELDRWKVFTRKSDGSPLVFETDGLVFTGPGEIKWPEDIPQDSRILDVRTFWRRIKELSNVDRETYVAVVGNGETAASTAVVIGGLDSPFHIDIIAPVAMSYSRGESFVENHMYTDPFKGNWHELTFEDRRNFIERTDRGVFSIATKKELDQMDNVNIIPGWFRRLEVNTANQLVVELEYNGRSEHRVYDYVVLSTGFDALGFLTRRTSEQTRNAIAKKANLKTWTLDEIEKNISEDLSIDRLAPKIHLPMMASLKQGPGFPNLSCLGRLSDHILLSYVSLDIEDKEV